MKILIIGAGGHGQVVADILLNVSKYLNSSYEPIGYLDDNKDLWGKYFLSIPVLGALKKASDIEHSAVIVAVGDNNVRKKIADELAKSGENFVSAIHPSAVIGANVKIGDGVMVCAGVVINTGSQIGNHVILNTSCSVDHHNTIGSFSHIAPGAHLGGDVRIGQKTLIGVGASIMPQCHIGNECIVGAGACVAKSLADGQTVVGVPARPIKSKIS